MNVQTENAIHARLIAIMNGRKPVRISAVRSLLSYCKKLDRDEVPSVDLLPSGELDATWPEHGLTARFFANGATAGYRH